MNNLEHMHTWLGLYKQCFPQHNLQSMILVCKKKKSMLKRSGKAEAVEVSDCISRRLQLPAAVSISLSEIYIYIYKRNK